MFDFSTLHTYIHFPSKIERQVAHVSKSNISPYKNGSSRYIYLMVIGDRTLLTDEETPLGKKYDYINF